MTPLFGPAGNSDSFRELGYKSTLDAPRYLVERGLDVYEYQCGRGVNISEKTAAALGEEARKNSIRLSLHAPYFISLSGENEEKRLGSIRYILQSAEAAHWMGALRIVVHAGSCGKRPREEALVLAKDTLRRALAELYSAGFGEIRPCIETMGKINQLGTLDEVMALCALDERLIPCIDFGHLNARTAGGLKTKANFLQVLQTIENALGAERLRCFHAHFSKIEYTEKGGEVRHLTFEDTRFGPDFEPLAEALAEKGCAPVLICESAGTQAEDAMTMKALYGKAAREAAGNA